MKKWYKTNLAKATLVSLAIILPMLAVWSLSVLYNASALDDTLISGHQKSYEESRSFESTLQLATSDTVEYVKAKSELEIDGKYDPNQKIDIINLYDNGTFYDEKNSSGLVYTVKQLADWGDEWNRSGNNEEDNSIVVCQKPDGTYCYYYLSDFKELIDSQKLRVELNLDEESTATFLQSLEDGVYSSSYIGSGTLIKNEKGNTEYVDCWTFGEGRKGTFPPEGYDTLLDAVNQNKALNGKLSKVYICLENAGYFMSSERESYQNPSEQWKEGNTNYKYLYLNAKKQMVYTNNSAWSDYEKAAGLLSGLENKDTKKPDDLNYIIVRNTRDGFVTNMDRTLDVEVWQEIVSGLSLGKGDVFLAAVDTSYPVQDIFQENRKAYEQYSPYVGLAEAGLLVSVVGYIVCLIWLTMIAGRKIAEEGVHLNGFDRWKTEIAAGIVFVSWFLWTYLAAVVWSSIRQNTSYLTDGTLRYYADGLKGNEIFIFILYAGGTAVFFIFGYLSLVRRIKGRTFWKNSILRMMCNGLKKCGKQLVIFWKGRKTIWRTLLACIGLFFLNLLGIASEGVLVPVILAADAFACYYLCRKAMAEDKIQTGIKRIAGGEVGYKIPLQGLKGDAKETAAAVNHIGEGMNVALENSMKSERLKTDLITNVSHDIKTPLTSIINYVELLKQENFEDPKIQRYLEILDEKSQRLKILTEDVVEASKVSSGNITLEYSNINLVEMIQQTSGEFAEKFGARHLTEVMDMPENPAIIRADGRRLWRVLSNIYNNAAKYAMPETRVYADLQVIAGYAVFSLKNISEQPLNIPANELTERFIRGDVSRSTEGSGLGLSIAESLTKMQGGTFGLYLDGDLFKVTISFPLV